MLAALGPAQGMDGKTALRVAGAFGGGIARMGLTCGAVTGGMMAIGLKLGQTTAGDDQAKQRTYALAREFAHRFTDCHGSITCRDLLGGDIGDPEQRRALQASGAFNSLCPRFISTAVQLLEELLSQA